MTKVTSPRTWRRKGYFMDNIFVNNGLTMAIDELIGRLSVEDEFIFDDIRIFSDCTSNTLPHPFKNGVFLQVNYSRFEFSPYISEEELSESLRKILRHNQLIIIGKTELDANLVLHIACFTKEDLRNE